MHIESAWYALFSKLRGFVALRTTFLCSNRWYGPSDSMKIRVSENHAWSTLCPSRQVLYVGAASEFGARRKLFVWKTCVATLFYLEQWFLKLRRKKNSSKTCVAVLECENSLLSVHENTHFIGRFNFTERLPELILESSWLSESGLIVSNIAFVTMAER